MAKDGKPKLPDNKSLIQAGINPKTREPLRIVEKGKQKSAIKRILNEIDRTQYCNRYKWYNLPFNLSSQEVERLLYIKGSLVAFYNEPLDEFCLLPYALEGGLDYYGRYKAVHPIPMANGADEEKSIGYKEKTKILSLLKLNIARGVYIDEPDYDEAVNIGVILYDRTPALAQTIESRYISIGEFIDMEAEYVPYMSTALLASAGIKGLRVPDQDANTEAYSAGQQFKTAALNQDMYVPITASVDFQELGKSAGGAVAQDYLLATQALENIRMSTLGLPNGGIFEKKAHELQQEADMNSSIVDPVIQDGLSWRQNFCNIFNSIWRTDMWVDINQSALAQDLDGDGKMYEDDVDGSGSGIQDLGGSNNGKDASND